ncbi:MAG: class I SAM-dependent methyltransferase [Phycisphaerae bacterium]|nr:class I SAM-dependent methyltransferase [Phycisphaerae bacterium]
MGNINDQIFIQNHISSFDGPYLEVGSKDYGNTQDIKLLFPKAEKYVGIDMEDGPRVDVVLDLSKSIAEIDEKLDSIRFETIFCLSVLEHCEDPFLVAKNLTNLLKPGGQICLSVPFALGFHGYPSDYWRFTHEGIKKLFPKLSFDLDRSVSATTRKNDFKCIDKELGRIPFSSKYYFQRGYLLQGVSAKILKILSRIGFLRWLVDYKYVMPPTHIYMIGKLNLREEK